MRNSVRQIAAMHTRKRPATHLPDDGHSLSRYERPMKRFAILIALVVIVTIGWIAGWFYIASRIESEVAVFAQADGQTQPRLECGT